MGVAGSGKTTLAREMLRQIWAVYLDNNFIVDAFFPETRTGKRYEKWRPHFYRGLYKIVQENLMVGNSVLLDVPHVKEMRDPKWRRWLKRLAQTAKAELVVIRCHCSDSMLRARLASRGKNRDSWKLTHWQEFLAEQPSLTPISLPHLDINTEFNLARNVATAVRYIRNFSERR
jgi:predicted kinase